MILSPLNKYVLLEDDDRNLTLVFPSGFKNSSYLNFSTLKQMVVVLN